MARRPLANGATGMSDMAGKAARVAVERSGRLPRYKADHSVKERGRVKQIYAAFMSPWDADEVFTSPWDVDEVFTSSTISFLLLPPITNHRPGSAHFLPSSF